MSLFINSKPSLNDEYLLTSTQLTCSQLIRGSAKEIFNPLTLCSLVLGGAVARSVELTCLKLFSSSSISFLSRFAPELAACFGVTLEGGIFATAPMLEGGGSFSELGIGTAHGAFVIGLSRFVGRYAHSNLVLGWIAQDCIVMGIDLTFEKLHLREVQNHGIVERWFHVRVIAFQMQFSGAICYQIPSVRNNQAIFALKKEIYGKNVIPVQTGIPRIPWTGTFEQYATPENITFSEFSLSGTREKKTEPHQKPLLVFTSVTEVIPNLPSPIRELYQKYPVAGQRLSKELHFAESVKRQLLQLKDVIYDNIKIEYLDSLPYEEMRACAIILAQLPPEVIRANFGEEIFWFTFFNCGTSSFETFLKTIDNLSEREIVEAVRKTYPDPDYGFIPTSFRTKALRLYERIIQNEILDIETFRQILKNSIKGERSNFALNRLNRYSLESLSIELGVYSKNGYDRKWSPCPKSLKTNIKQWWKIYLDAPFGIALLYDGEPNAIISFAPTYPNHLNSPYLAFGDWRVRKISSFELPNKPVLKIYQYQGISPLLVNPFTDELMYDQSNQPLKGNAWGLNGLDWKKALTEVVIKVAQEIDFGAVTIQGGKNNRWTHPDRTDIYYPLLLERALKIYDETADRLGFQFAEDANWYKVL